MLIKIRTVDGVAYDLVRLDNGKLYWQRIPGWISHQNENERMPSHLKDSDIFSRSEISTHKGHDDEYNTLNKYYFFFEYREDDLGSPLAT